MPLSWNVYGFQTNTCRKNSTTTVKVARTLKRLNRQVDESVVGVDPREVKGEIRTGIIQSYADDVAAGREIGYKENDAKLYKNMQVFAEIMDIELD